jgi:hypothetical protein
MIFLFIDKEGQGNIAMHVEGFLHKLLSPVIHNARIKALSDVVTAAITTKSLMLTELGRGIDLPIQERSGIQKVNRLLGNKHLGMEQESISRAVADALIGPKKHPVIIVDWSKFPNSKEAVIRAALAAQGRALTLYEERHAIKKMGNRKVQTDFLNTLKRVLPKDCRSIIVTDAGFHNDWFKEVLNLGWDYVGRIRGLKKYCSKGDEIFLPCSDLFKQATHNVKYMGEKILTRKNPFKTHLYLVKSKLKGRKALTKQGKVRRDKDSKAYSRAHREPWLLATSFQGRKAGKKVKLIYARRMTIEEAFRDLKSSKYGFGLEEGKTRQKKRRAILLLIAMLASLIAWLAGKIGEQMKWQYQFQSNSIKDRRVLSLFYLGCQLIKKRFRIPLSLMWETLESLKKEMCYE